MTVLHILAHYPFFKSGNIIVNSIEKGLFVVRPSIKKELDVVDPLDKDLGLVDSPDKDFEFIDLLPDWF
jgi:hypothetical protein